MNLSLPASSEEIIEHLKNPKVIVASVALLAFIGIIRKWRKAKQFSIVLLGESRSAEKLYSKAYGVDINRFLNTAGSAFLAFQVGADESNITDILQKEFPSSAGTYLLLCGVNQLRGNNEVAKLMVEKAKSVEPASPWLQISPTVNELNKVFPPMVLEEVVKNSVWKATEESFNNLFLFRLKDGNLAIVNAINYSETLIAQIKSMGKVSHIISNTKFHYKYIERSREVFPDALVYGVPSHKTHPPSKNMHFSGYLDDKNPILKDDFTFIEMKGHDLTEFLVYHNSTKSIVIGDFGLCCVPNYANKIYAATFGIFPSSEPELKQMNYHLLQVKSLPALQSSLRTLFSIDVDRILPIHGGSVHSDCKGQLQRAFGWPLKLGTIDLLFLVVRSFMEKPGLLSAIMQAGKKKQ